MRSDGEGIQCVINFDFPNNGVGYVYRIARMGRTGTKGTAVTFFARSNIKNALELFQSLSKAGKMSQMK